MTNPLAKIGPLGTQHYGAFIKMNQDFVAALAPMDYDAMQSLLVSCSYARQIGNDQSEAQGVLLGYLDTDAYDSENINWIRARYQRFAYIDRVVIDGAAQGKGFGRALYDDFERFAMENGCSHVTCEVNVRPSNPASHNFHLALGYEAIGEEETKGGKVRVRYYAKPVSR